MYFIKWRHKYSYSPTINRSISHWENRKDCLAQIKKWEKEFPDNVYYVYREDIHSFER